MALIKTELNKNQVVNKINSFIEAFQTWCNNPEGPTTQNLEKFLTPNFQLFSDGELKYRDLKEYLQRLNGFREKYSQVEINGPFDEPLVIDNQAVITYEMVRFSEEEGEVHLYTMAIVTLQGEKISKWVQVTHYKDMDIDY